ncbi:MAG: hypothetical protein ACYSUI_03005 [Planctomycetota bacterium]|jgi:hypothetical protein
MCNLSDIVAQFPDTWQQLWHEQYTVRCMKCGDVRDFASLLSITQALVFPCPFCGGIELNGYDSAGDRSSILCGRGHGSTITTYGCLCLKEFLLTGESFAPPLYIPEGNAPVLCRGCEEMLRRAGEWDKLVDRLGCYCLFCMARVLRTARRNRIPICAIGSNGQHTVIGEDDGTCPGEYDVC